MSFFLEKYYNKKYILDIRDYNISFKWSYFLKKIVSNSLLTVISSGGFKEWLPNDYEYLIDHNVIIQNERFNIGEANEKNIKIVNCGIIRSLNENLYLIKELKNETEIELEYHGESSISRILEKYVKENNIKNCKFYGYYKKKDENIFLLKSTFINIMQTNDFLSKYALPNRFYKAIILKKPIIATSDNYVGNLVEKYNLGIVINKLLITEGLEKELKEFMIKFNIDDFSKNCDKLYKIILEEKNNFEQRISECLNM